MTQWGKKNVVSFYSNNRNKIQHLYDSEKKPLSFINKKSVKTILDYGCAVGGFYLIFKKYLKRKISYLGLDTEQNVINSAKKKFKKNNNVKFLKIKKGKLNIKSKKYDLTFSTGVLNHNKDYKKIITELLRVSSKYTFIDSPRVHFGKDFIGKLNLSNRFPSDITSKNIVNNYTINLKNYLSFLKKIFKKNNISYVVFYYGNLPYKKRYLKINKKISFLTFLTLKEKNLKKIKYKILTKEKKVKKMFKDIFDEK